MRLKEASGTLFIASRAPAYSSPRILVSPLCESPEFSDSNVGLFVLRYFELIGAQWRRRRTPASAQKFDHWLTDPPSPRAHHASGHEGGSRAGALRVCRAGASALDATSEPGWACRSEKRHINSFLGEIFQRLTLRCGDWKVGEVSVG